MSDPSSYKGFLKKRFFAGFWYLYFVLLFTSLALMVPVGIGLLAARPLVLQTVESAKTEVPNLYPSKLVIRVKHGQVSTNVKEPYSIPLPASWKEFSENTSNLLTINTKASVDDFSTYHSLFLLTKTSLVMPDKNGTYRIIPLKDSEDITINRAMYNEVSGAALRYVNWLPRFFTAFAVCLMFVLPFLVAFLRLAGYLLYLLITTVLLLLLQHIVSREFTFSELYRLSLFGLTLPLILSVIKYLVPVHLPFAFTIIFFVWMIVILKRLPLKAVSAR